MSFKNSDTIKTWFIIGLLAVPLSEIAAQGSDAFNRKSFILKKDTLLYRILLPEKFQEDLQYPLLLFLHGAGERGNDNEKQLVHGAKIFLKKENRTEYPAIVVFPQCPKDDFWSNVVRDVSEDGQRNFTFQKGGKPNPAMKLTMKLIHALKKEPFVDVNRIYVGGLSMGGMGTFEIVGRMPGTFAAAFPICGGGNPDMAKKYARKVPFWIFHGAKDDVVLPKYSEQMVKAIQNHGGEVKLTLYPNANHNSWDAAFAEPELMPWIFSNTR